MVKASDIRIGNFIRSAFGDEWMVREIYQSKALIIHESGALRTIEYEDKKWQAIPLTQEWLKRCGFADRTEGYRATGASGGVWVAPSSFNGKDIALYENYADGKIWSYYLGHYGLPITSVHQLQNLFYALCGEELTIKDPA